MNNFNSGFRDSKTHLACKASGKAFLLAILWVCKLSTLINHEDCVTQTIMVGTTMNWKLIIITVLLVVQVVQHIIESIQLQSIAL